MEALEAAFKEKNILLSFWYSLTLLNKSSDADLLLFMLQ